MNTERTPPQDLGQPGAQRAGVQDLDPALAERLHQLRKGLGLSVEKMADKLGLWGANGGDNLRQMERCKRPMPGTLQVLLGYMEREQQQAGAWDRIMNTPYRSVLADLDGETRARLGLPAAPKA